MSTINLDTKYGTVKIADGKLTLNCRWQGCEQVFKELVERIDRSVWDSPSVPDRDRAVADAIVAELGGRVISHVSVEDLSPDGKIY